MERIIVGVDGSPASKAALAWAGEEASVRGDRVVAVRACTPRVIAPLPWPGIPVGIPASTDAEEDARLALAADVDEVLGPDVNGAVEQRVVRGKVVPTLLDVAYDAKLLVLGSPGHGRLGRLVMGSVSRECARRAPCPVVVVQRRSRR